MNRKPSVAVIGGTGALGFGLALRWAKAGYEVIIGSRDPTRAASAARECSDMTAAQVRGADSESAARHAEVVVVAVPFAAQADTLAHIRDAVQGKVVVDTTVPLVPPKVMRVQLPPEKSAARRAQTVLGTDVRVVSAFQNVAATHLRDLDHAVEGDVLVTGDDADARETVVELAAAIGLRAWHAGSLDNAVVAEGLTSILLFLNKRYGFDGAGIRICGERKPS
jgi:NADPH-dependent F420 reductase